jgi:molecular chaperone GrpE (heat shock protein)
MEQENKSSLWLYEQLRQNAVQSDYRPTVEAMKQLLGRMEWELLIDGCSPLFSSVAEIYPSRSVINILSKRYAPKSFTLDSVQQKIPVYDSYILISCLAGSMRGGDIAQQLDEALPFLFSNSPTKPADLSAKHIDETIQTIDRLIPQRRIELLVPKAQTAPVNETSSQSAVLTETDDQKIDVEDSACESSPGMVADTLVESDAQNPAVMDAQALAEQIIADAEAMAAHKIAMADQRVIELTHAQRLQHSQEAQHTYSEGIYALQQTLQEINTQMKLVGEQTRELDTFVTEESVRKAHINLIELYNLIADTRDSQMERVHDTQNEDLKNSVFNLDVFLDMIAEYLADYGIVTISTEPNAAFNPTFHVVPQTMKNYNPQSLIVRRSVRKGFAWGEQVLQKERVETK